MSERPQNTGGIPTFVDGNIVGYLLIEVGDGHIRTMPVLPDRIGFSNNMVRPEKIKALEVIEFKFTSQMFRTKDDIVYECWVADVISGKEYLYRLDKDKFISLPQAHGWLRYA